MSAAVWSAAGALFLAGLFMAVLRRQLLAKLMGLELLLAAASLAAVRRAGLHGDAGGQAAAALVLAVAAAEAVVGLSLILEFRRLGLEPEAEALEEGSEPRPAPPAAEPAA